MTLCICKNIVTLKWLCEYSSRFKMSGVFLVKTGQGAVYLVLIVFISFPKELLKHGINLGRHFATLLRQWRASKILDEKMLPAANNVKLQPCGWNMLTSIRLQVNVSKWNNSSRSVRIITLKINLIWYLVWDFHHPRCRCYISITQSALQSNIQVTSVPFGLKLCCIIKGHCLIHVNQHQWKEFKCIQTNQSEHINIQYKCASIF